MKMFLSSPETLKDEIILQTLEVPDSPSTTSSSYSEKDRVLGTHPVTRLRFWIVFITLSLVLCTNGIDANVLGDIAPSIAVALRTEHVSWLASITLIMATCLILPMGALYRILEPKFILLGSLVLSALGQAVAGSAKTFNVLIVGRVLVGIALASTVVAAFLLVSMICSNTRERAMYLALVTALYGVMIKVGPLIAGAFLKQSQSNWRWCFYVELPIILVTCVLLIIGFPRFKPLMSQSTSSQNVTWRAGVSSVVQALFVICLLLPCLLGGSTISWKSPLLVVCYIAALPSAAIFVLWEHRSPKHDRLLPLTALRTDRRLVCISAVTFSAMLVTFAATYWIPIYFQIVYKSSPLRAAVQLLPFAAAGTVACVIVGKIVEKTGNYYYCCVIGSGIQILGAGLFMTIRHSTPLTVIYVYGALTGIGFGSLSALGNTIALHNVKSKDFAQSIAWINFVLLLSASLGIGIQGVMFSTELKFAAVEIEKILTGVDLSKVTLNEFLQYIHGASPGDTIARIGQAHTITAQRHGTALYLTCGVISLVASVLLPRARL